LDVEAWNDFVDRTRVTTFSQNIAAIRSEHTVIDRQKSQSLREMLHARSPLLELDLSGVDAITDRPPAYHPALSSRSDELMLYGTFDALRVWVKPAIVVIVATDIRDRLFLLNEVRKSLPGALPVLLEMDYLTAHPDYRKISRGAIVIPNGDTLLCVDKDGDLIDCRPSDFESIRGVDGYRSSPADSAVNRFPPALEPSQAGAAERESRTRKSYLSFPSDYAANMFRVTLGLIEQASEDSRAGDVEPMPEARLFVTTLAGFQAVSSPRHNRLLAADGRLSLERPAAVFLLIAGLLAAAIALWLRIQGRRHLVMVAPLRHMKPSSGLCEDGFHSIAPTETAGSSDTDSGIRRAARWLPVVLISVVSPIILLAAVRVYELFFSTRPGGTWELAHGRDGEALLCLFLLYLFAALIGGWRLYLWRSRCLSHFGMLLDVAPVSASESSAIGRDQIAISGFAVGVVGLLLMGWFRGVPTAVDSSWPAIVVAFTLLLLGVWFLAELWSESRRLTWFAHLLAPTVDIPADGPGTGHDSSTKSAGDSWASPQRLHAFPQSPFNLHFRTRDLEAIHAYPDDAWRTDTRRLLVGEWPFGPDSGATFKAWQARLVAEMRYGAVAIRSCAWSAVLAPTTILLGMAVYPPVNERLMTTAAVVLILIGFALIMYLVIQWEQHPLLGRMFTQHGDKLSVGGVVGALWGKLAAASIILVPVLFPEVLSGLHGLLQSIDSFR
jgi:hypothetical protein